MSENCVHTALCKIIHDITKMCHFNLNRYKAVVLTLYLYKDVDVS